MHRATESIRLFGYLLRHMSSVLQRQSDQILQERLGIGMSQFKLLMILRDERMLTQRTLATMLSQTEASISRQIKVLCEKNLVVTKTNPTNRREHLAYATPKGVKLADAAREVLDAYHQPVLDGLSTKEAARLVAALQKAHVTLCAEGKPHACDHAQQTPTVLA